LAVCPLHALAQGTDSLWQRLPLEFDDFVSVLRAENDTADLYMSGFGGKVNGKDSSLVRWNGQSATFMQPPFDDGDRLIVYKGKVLVSGTSYGAPVLYKLAYYDGQSWTTLGAWSSQTGTGAAPIGVLNDQLVVTGLFDSIGGKAIKFAAIWDGGVGWRDLHRIDTLFPLPPTPFLDKVVEYKGEVYVGGLIYAQRDLIHIARFDGNSWMDVGGGIHGNGMGAVTSMLVWKNELYVAGEFFERDGSPGNCIAKWDGQKWHRLGGGITQGRFEASIYDMAVYEDNLYVVGAFSEADGIPVNNIAKWDGKRWCSLNTYFGFGTPSQIEVAKGELYISGALSVVNGDTVSNVARWTGGDYTYECGPLRLNVDESPKVEQAFLYPNPASDMLFTKRDDIAGLSIYDVNGRMVKMASVSELQAGVDVSGFAVGFYFVRAAFSSGEVISSRFVKQ
jgi:hypothetical protein